MAQMPLTIAVEFPDDVIELIARLNRQNTEIIRRLGQIEQRLGQLDQAVDANTVNDTFNTEALMADFTALHDEVEANGDAVDSAVTLLNTLSEQLADAADDPAEVQAIAAALADQSTALAAAVAANTPAAPTPA
jgi:chromosome segregation ATPase